ncbi:MAG: EamA family transporter [Desulfurococcales archaeon]|nr:EamA family transporter [Desulfurococcales archaeon]
MNFLLDVFGSLFLLGSVILCNSTVNTTLAFASWYHALKVLRAYEQSILQNTVLIQITLLAYTFLGEMLALLKIFGITTVFTGVLIVQLSRR